LLILNDISAAIENRARHRVDNARLICALQSCDEIHGLRIEAASFI
jgi:hypothetical protein